MSNLIAKLNKVASTKESLRVAINTLNESEVLSEKAEFDTYPNFIIPPKTYTVRIDLNNSNPERSCKYMDDAVGMTPGYTGWQNEPIIQSIKPCILNNGSVVYYLNKDNYTKKEDGGSANLIGGAGDVMVEIPKIGYKLWNDGIYQYVSVTSDPAKADYCYYAHSLNSTGDCDKIYIGAYLGYVTSYKLYSRSQMSPTSSTSLTNFRTYSSNRGTGYSIVSFFPWTLLQCIYVIIYRNLNSQAALGQGYIGASTKAITGATNSNTFCYGTSSDTTHMKFLGIEDMWGNLGQWLDGIYCDNNYNIKTDYKNSVFTGTTGDNFQFSTPGNRSSGNIKAILGTNISGFVLKSTDGDYNNDYFSDDGIIYSGGRFAGYAGYRQNDNTEAGAFRLSVNCTASLTDSCLGARLMYKHLSS